MLEKFLVYSSGTKDGKGYAFLRAIRSGTKKGSKDTYSFIDEKSFMREEEALPVGSIISYERKRVTASDNKFAKAANASTNA